MIQKLLDYATESGCISRPSLFWMPEGAPLSFAACAVTLPEGCAVVESQVSHRLAIGAGTTENDAAFKAQMEAIERYSIQFRLDAPECFTAFKSSTSNPPKFKAERVYVGKPHNTFDVTTVGCAAGTDLESAGIRACCEQLEHHFFVRYRDESLELSTFAPSVFACLAEVVPWLDNQYRKLEIRLVQETTDFIFALVTCSDQDFGRLALGRSCALDPETAVFKAATEAILSWRNMVELERNGKGHDALLETERMAMAKYRGVLDSDRLPDGAKGHNVVLEKRNQPFSLDQVLAKTCNVLENDVSLVELTVPILRIPVVRAICH